MVHSHMPSQLASSLGFPSGLSEAGDIRYLVVPSLRVTCSSSLLRPSWTKSKSFTQAGRAHVPSFFQNDLSDKLRWSYSSYMPSKTLRNSLVPTYQSKVFRPRSSKLLKSLCLLFSWLKSRMTLAWSLNVPHTHCLFFAVLAQASLLGQSFWKVSLIFGMDDAPTVPQTSCTFLHCCTDIWFRNTFVHVVWNNKPIKITF